MPKRLSEKEIVDFLQEKNCILESKYINNKTPITYILACGHKISNNYDSMKRGKGVHFICDICTPMSKRERLVKNLGYKAEKSKFSYKKFEAKFKSSLKYREDFNPTNDFDKFITCNSCLSNKHRSLFFNKKTYFNNKENICKKCNIECMQKRRQMSTQRQIIGAMINTCNARTKKWIKMGRTGCGIVNITIDYVLFLDKSQNSRCIYTKSQFVWKYSHENCPSIDRIDSSQGYVQGNIQLVSKISNVAKCDMSEEAFCKFRKLLSANLYLKLTRPTDKIILSVSDSFLNKLVKTSKYSAIKRNEINGTRGEHEVTKELLLDVAQKQNNKCSYTGVELKWETSSDKMFRASIDRKNSKLGYTRDNIQLVSFAVNIAKSNMSEEKWFKFRESIARNL